MNSLPRIEFQTVVVNFPSQAKVLTGGGEFREAQFDVPLSHSRSCA